MLKTLVRIGLRSLSITIVAGGGIAAAQQAVELLDDIELTVASGADSSPRFLASDGQRAFFVHDSPTGAVLRVSDGTQAGTLVLLDQGIAGAPEEADGIVLPNGTAVFWLVRDDGLSVPYASDGTAAGTIALPVLASDVDASIVEFAGEAWLVAPDPDPQLPQARLYRTDGSAQGTVLATPQDGLRWEPVAGPTHLFFANREDPTTPFDTVLYAIDATGAPAQPYLAGGPFDEYRPIVWVPSEGVLLAVSSRPEEVPYDQWVVTDGGAPETLLQAPGLDAAWGVVADGRAYFGAGGSAFLQSLLYSTDGTLQGTWPVLDAAGQETRLLSEVAAEPVDGGVVFVGFSSFATLDFFVGFASPDGAEVLMQLDEETAEWTFHSVSGFVRWEEFAYFGVGTPLFAELARTDGTPAGTTLVTDLDGGVLKPFAGDGRTVNGLFFSYSATPLDGFEPWLFDGQQLDPFDDYLPPNTASSDPRALTELGPRILFVPHTEALGREPWITDGSLSGTGLIEELLPGPSGGLAQDLWPATDYLTQAVVGDRVLLEADLGEGLTVVSTDGSAGASVPLPLPQGLVLSLVSNMVGDRFVTAGDWAYFTADVPGIFQPVHLLRTDGLVVEDLSPEGLGEPLNRRSMFPAEGLGGFELFFAGAELETGQELWGHDGAAGGAALVADIHPGPPGSLPRNGVKVGDRYLFTAEEPSNGREVWVSDGTAAGTQLLADIEPGPGSGAGLLGGVAIDGAYVVIGAVPGAGPIAVDPATGVFQSLIDPLAPAGTAASTTAVFPVAGGLAFLAKDEGSEALDLWYSPSPWSVAAKVQAIGAEGSFEASAGSVYDVGGGVALFSGRDAKGSEPWILSAGQVRPLFDINPGPKSSSPAAFGRAGERVVMAATTVDFGRELFTTTVATLGANVVETLPAGCAGEVPALGTQGRPVLGANVDLTLTGASSDAPLIWLAGSSFELPSLSMPCAPLLVDPFVLASGAASPAGDAQLALTVPADPGFLDLHLVLQAVVLDGTGPFLGGASLSDGLELVVGP